MGPSRHPKTLGLALALALALGSTQGCRQLNASHCGNLAGDETCAARGDALAYCSVCVAENDGCVDSPVDAPTCLPAGASTDPSATSASPSGATGSDAMSSTSTASASSTGSTSASSTGSTSATSSTSLTDSTGSTSSTNSTNSTSATGSYCGDGVLDPGENCDTMDLDGESCASLGESGGTLQCDDRCNFDKSECCIPGGEPCELGGTPCCGMLNCELAGLTLECK